MNNTKEVIRYILECDILYNEGLKNINGSYCNVDIYKMRKNKKSFSVRYTAEFGVQEDNRSERYTVDEDIKVPIELIKKYSEV